MKHIVISLVWLLFVAGCSTDHGDAENAATGSYVAKNGALLINAELSSGKCWRITAFNGGYVFSQYVNVVTSGQYPDLVFSGNDFIFSCSFSDAGRFSANVSGKLPNNVAGGTGFTEISGTYIFNKYNGILDENGDGILDQ